MEKNLFPDNASTGAPRKQEKVIQGKKSVTSGKNANAPWHNAGRKNLLRLTKKELHDLILKYQDDMKEQEKNNTKLRKRLHQLEEAQQSLSYLYDNAPVGYLTLDANGLIRSANFKCATMLAVDRFELFALPFHSFILDEDIDTFNKHIEGVLKSGNPSQSVLRLKIKSGLFFHAQLESSVISEEDGSVKGIGVTVSDVSKLKSMEKRLQQKRAILKGIIDATDFMLVYLDTEFNFVWVNPAYARECRMEPEQMAGKNLFDLFPYSKNRVIFCRVRDTGEPVYLKDMSLEYPDQPERGVTYWDWSLIPDKNDTGEVVGLVFSLRETTKTKRAEIELAGSEEFHLLLPGDRESRIPKRRGYRSVVCPDCTGG